MDRVVKHLLPFYSDAFHYMQAQICKKVDEVSSYEELQNSLEEILLQLKGDMSSFESNYEIYRNNAFNSWLTEEKESACIQSIGSSSGWTVSFYFKKRILEGFREVEVEQIKQAALDCLNADKKASEVGLFLKVTEIEDDICSSTAFTCSCF